MEKALNIVSSSTSPSSLIADDRRQIDSGKPMRFVYFDENDNLRLDSDAIDVLQRNTRPVAVVSVFGPARQGKSFILNQLLGKSLGFQIGSDHQSCTKGLWMWSEPLKRTTLDGSEYDMLLFDTCGINSYDQMGMHSTKMFTLAVLLSSMFIYNQVGPIDEAALDHLSLVTELTKHVHVRASERNDSISGFEYATPVFLWLLRDFYLDLMDDNRRMTPMLDSRTGIAKKDQIRESIRAFFPNQECFTLVRPLNNETELQHLDQVSPDKFRPEFCSGLDVFMKFVNERTRPKRVGGSTVTGPFLATITKFVLDFLNDSTFPIIPSSWQIRARDAFVEADSHCSEVIKGMEKELQEALQVSNASLEHVSKVLEVLISKYEASVHGPTKWQKLSLFLWKSLQGPILVHAKKLLDQISLEKSSLLLKSCSTEGKFESLRKQLEASQNLQAEYQKHYDDAIKDFTKVSDQYKNRIREMEQKYRILEERCSTSFETLDFGKLDSLQLGRKDHAEKRADIEEHVIAKSADDEAGKIAAAESLRVALKEAQEWQEKYDSIVNESKDSLEKTSEQSRYREEALRAKFTDCLAEKDTEIRTMATKIEDCERRLASFTSDLKAAETKIENYDSESSALKLQIKELAEKHELVKASYQSMEKETKVLTEARIQLEEKYTSEFKRFEEAYERLKLLEEEAKNNKNTETAQMEDPSGSQQIIIDTEKDDLADRSATSVEDVMSKIALLEATIRGKDEEIESLKKKCEQFSSLIPEQDDGILESESFLPKSTEEHLKQEFTPESSGESFLKTSNKRLRLEFSDATPTLQKCTKAEVDSVFEAENVGRVDCTKLTVVKLRQELEERGFGNELRKLKNPKKKDILSLYKKLMFE